MITEYINKIAEGKDLSYDEAKEMMDEIMTGKLTDAQISSYLTALKMKGESVDEIYASAASMREQGLKVNPHYQTLDIVGTGGDKAFTFNISTISAIVVSSLGVKVTKHGNRSVSSKCGAADLLEALGVNINIDVEKAVSILDEIGICFLFAQKYHQAMKYVAKVRKELGIRTIFNILGPLANPANAGYTLLGVYSKELVEVLAHVLAKLGTIGSIVVHGLDGLDEITLSDDTYVAEVRGNSVKTYIFDPTKYGFKKCRKEDLVGGSPEENAQIALDILKGQKGPKRDAVILNSAYALYCSKEDCSLEQSFKLVTDAIDSGKAYNQLQRFIELSNK